MAGPFAWCELGQHDHCKRSYRQYWVDPKTSKPVYTGEIIYCECKRRDCECYVPAKLRGKVRKARRK